MVRFGVTNHLKTQPQIGDSRLKDLIISPTFCSSTLGVVDDLLHLQPLSISTTLPTSPSTPTTSSTATAPSTTSFGVNNKEEEPLDSAGFERLSRAKLGPTCLWDLALKEDPVPAYTSTELGEPDKSVFH